MPTGADPGNLDPLPWLLNSLLKKRSESDKDQDRSARKSDDHPSAS